MTELSVIIPTYNEVENIEELIKQLEEQLKGVNYEILVMDDDSPDKTGEKVQELKAQGHNCSVIIRKENKGLSPAVIEGFEKSKGEIKLVMDADLQHPVEVVPKLYEAVKKGAEVAVGSRHCPGGGIENWAFHRRVISWGAAMMARPFTTVSDPMSGFFAFNASILNGVKLEAKGYKILLEVLVKTKCTKVVEVPITFTTRIHGESKLTSGVMINYILHLWALFCYPGTCPLLKFLVVGGLGTVVDLTIFTILSMIGLPVLISQGFSFIAALCNNFFLNSLWTFPQEVDKNEKMKQFIKFAIVSCCTFGIRTVLFTIGKSYVPNQFPYIQILLFFVILSVTIINFLGSKFLVFKN